MFTRATTQSDGTDRSGKDFSAGEITVAFAVLGSLMSSTSAYFRGGSWAQVGLAGLLGFVSGLLFGGLFTELAALSSAGFAGAFGLVLAAPIAVQQAVHLVGAVTADHPDTGEEIASTIDLFTTLVFAAFGASSVVKGPSGGGAPMVEPVAVTVFAKAAQVVETFTGLKFEGSNGDYTFTDASGKTLRMKVVDTWDTPAKVTVYNYLQSIQADAVAVIRHLDLSHFDNNPNVRPPSPEGLQYDLMTLMGLGRRFNPSVKQVFFVNKEGTNYSIGYEDLTQMEWYKWNQEDAASKSSPSGSEAETP